MLMKIDEMKKQDMYCKDTGMESIKLVRQQAREAMRAQKKKEKDALVIAVLQGLQGLQRPLPRDILERILKELQPAARRKLHI